MTDQYLGTAVRARKCDQCGRSMAKAHRIHQGGAYCSICYPRLFPQRQCTVCGKAARAHKEEAVPICRSCHLKDRICLRCHKPTPRGALRVGNGIACGSCARYYKPEERCGICDRPSLRLSALSSAPEIGRICEKCRRDHSAATCSCCGKHRTVHFQSLDRLPLCRLCAADPAAQHPCPDCGVDVGGVGEATCFACGIKRSNMRKVQAAEELLQTETVRRLVRDFYGWMESRGNANKFAAGASRYVTYLAKLDAALAQGSGDLDNEMLVRTFSTEELRRMGKLAQHLAEIGLLTADGDQRRANTEVRLIEQKLEEATRQPWGPEIAKYHVYMQHGREKKLSDRSVRSYLTAANALMGFAKKSAAHSLTQGDVDRYLRRKPGARASLSPFLRYVEATAGVSVKAVARKKSPVSDRKRIREIATLLRLVTAEETSWAARRGCFARLLALLYTRPVQDVVTLRTSDVREYAKGYQLHLGEEWCDIEPDLAPSLGQLLTLAKEQQLVHDPWLFPGRSANDHLSSAAVTSIIQRLNTT